MLDIEENAQLAYGLKYKCFFFHILIIHIFVHCLDEGKKWMLNAQQWQFILQQTSELESLGKTLY